MKFQKEKEKLDLFKDKIRKRPADKKFALFDADGTIWAEDANKILLDYQMRNKIRDLSEVLNPKWSQEKLRYKRCELFVQKQEGFSLEEFREHSREALKQDPLHVFPFQRELVQYAKQKGLKIVVITASIKWLVEEALNCCNFPADLVLGIKTKLKKGNIISSEIVRPAPTARSKGEVFLEYGSKESVFLAGGNTLTDLSFLEMADCPFVVQSAKKGHENFPGERELSQVASQRNWTIFNLEE